MELYKLTISCPKIMTASQTHQTWLENVFKNTLVEYYVRRITSTKPTITRTEEGPVFKVDKIDKQQITKTQTFIEGEFKKSISASDGLRQVILPKDLVVKVETNFDELVKKLPELKGIF
jgi:hypothetical protein